MLVYLLKITPNHNQHLLTSFVSQGKIVTDRTERNSLSGKICLDHDSSSNRIDPEFLFTLIDLRGGEREKHQSLHTVGHG